MMLREMTVSLFINSVVFLALMLQFSLKTLNPLPALMNRCLQWFQNGHTGHIISELQVKKKK